MVGSTTNYNLNNNSTKNIMMKKIIMIVLIAISTLPAFAQVDNFRQQLDLLFGQLDKTKVASGYLAPYGIDGVDKADFNGILADTNTCNSLDLFRFLYADILTAKFNPASPSLPTLESINQTFLQADRNTLAIFYANYEVLNESAIQLGFLRYVGGKLYDNSILQAKVVLPSAYISKKLFAVNPLTQYYKNTVTLKFNPSLFYNNANVTVLNLYVNFGAGYINMPANTSLSNTYTDSTGFHRIAIKAELSNGTVVETYTAPMVEVTTPTTGSRYTLADLANPDITIPATANQSGCKVYIRRSINTRAVLGQNTTQVTRPFIIAEGLDTHDGSSGLDKSNYDVNNLIRELDIIFFNGNRVTENLDDIGQYDLVFIDWNNGVDDIRRNAATMELVINAINARKIGTQQNVVMGISMGGLVARYCLADMTKRSVPTQTRLLISHDSPHQGSYVPLSLQHIVTGLQNKTLLGIRLGSILRVLDQGVALLNKPAAQQELIMTSADENGTVHYNTFLNDIYRPMITFPTSGPQPQYRFVATSQGSQCGVGTLPVGGTLAFGEAEGSAGGPISILTLGLITRLRLKIAITAKGLSANNQGNEIAYFRFRRESSYFFGLVTTTKTFIELHRNEPILANPIPWESVPAGTIGLPNNTTIADQDNWSFLSMGFLGYDYRYAVATQFSFLPTISALDVVNPASINKDNIFTFNASAVAQQNLFNPVSKVAQDQVGGTNNFNIHHTDFTSRNARWIFNEMQNNTQDCDVLCSNLTPIIGDDVVCSSSIYKINNLPANAVITWSVISANGTLQLLQNTPAVNQLTINNYHFSSVTGVTLVALINIGSCNYVITKQIANDNDAVTPSYGYRYEQPTCLAGNVQHPTESGYTINPTFFHQGCYAFIAVGNEYTSVTSSGGTPLDYGLTNYTFQYSSPYYQTVKCLYFNLPLGSGGVPFTFDLSKGVGGCGRRLLFFSITANGKNAPQNQSVIYTATPNPVLDIVNVKVLNNSNSSSKNLATGEYVIQIAELNTNLPLKQLRIKKTGGDFQINMAGLKTGYYAVEINDGINKQVLKIFKL
jgi:hypothetical protein